MVAHHMWGCRALRAPHDKGPGNGRRYPLRVASVSATLRLDTGAHKVTFLALLTTQRAPQSARFALVRLLPFASVSHPTLRGARMPPARLGGAG